LSWSAPRSLCLVLKDYPLAFQEAAALEIICRGVQAIEFRVDCFNVSTINGTTPISEPAFDHGHPDLFSVFSALAFLRQHSGLPVLFTLRTAAQGGRFQGSTSDYIRLIEAAFRLSCDFVDIELLLPKDQIAQLMGRKGRSKVVLSHTWLEADPIIAWHGPEIQAIYEEAKRLGADAVKLIKPARSIKDNIESISLQSTLAANNDTPLIALNSGLVGRLSRQLNPFLSPVTHPNIPTDRIKQFLTAPQMNDGLRLSGLLVPKKIYYQNNGKDEASARKLQAGFEELHLPFSIQDAGQADLTTLIKDSDFGGSLTDIQSRSDRPFHCAPSARAIGFIDLVSVEDSDASSYLHVPDVSRSERRYHLQNLRSKAITNSLTAHLSPVNAIVSATSAIVDGASQQSHRAVFYSLADLGIDLIYAINCSDDFLDFAQSLAPKFKFQILVGKSLDNLPAHHSHRAPSIVIFCSEQKPLPSSLLDAPTGGTMLVMDGRVGQSTDNGWIQVGQAAIERELTSLRFATLTGGKRIPQNILDVEL